MTYNVILELSHYLSSSTHRKTLMGVGLSIAGNVLISVALNVQKYAHNNILSRSRSAEEEALLSIESSDMELNDDLIPKLQKKKYWKSRLWWLGLILMILGEVGNFLAYGFAPASLIAPLGTVGLISNAVIAPLFLQEIFRTRDFAGILLAMGGAVMVVFTSKNSDSQLPPDKVLELFFRTKVYIYICVCVGLMIFLLGLSKKYGKKTVLIDLFIVALFGGFTVLSTKAVSSLLSTVQMLMFTYLFTYLLLLVLVSTAILQVKYLNKALQNFDSTVVIPTQFVLFTLSVVTGSAVLYDDFENFTGIQYFTFIVGCFLTFFGVYLIASQRESITNSFDGSALFEQARSHSRNSSSSSIFDPETLVPTPNIYSPTQRRGHGHNLLIAFPSFSPTYTYNSSVNYPRLSR